MTPLRRIAHILPFPGIGGTEHATLRIAQAVAPHGYESIMVCLHDTESLRNLFAEGGFPITVWPATEPSIRHGKAFLDASRALAAEFKRLQVQLVHCSDALAGYYVAFAGYLAKLPVLCHIRNRHPEMSRRVRFYLRPVTHFAFVSKDTWRHFPLAVPERKGSVIYDGVTPVSEEALIAAKATAAGVRAEFGIAPEVKLIGMVARVSPQKDYETLITAASRVVAVHPEARFMIVGDYSSADLNRTYYAKLRELLEQSGMARYFIFTGYRSDVPRLLDAFDIAVLSTHQEGLPLVLLEGMARAKPTIATAVDGIPELIDGTNGLLYPHGDAAKLSESLLDLLDHPETCDRLSMAGRKTVLSKFTTEKFTSSMVELYGRLLPKS
jgi:glycosyltransferase involved in cell wall biosynthesis